MRRALLATVAGAAAGVVFWRRRSRERREHVDLYFADGSMVSFASDAPEATRLMPLARRVLASARR